MNSTITATASTSQGSTLKEAFKKAIIFSIPLFILNYIIVTHVIQDIGLPYFLTDYQTTFFILFNFIPDFIMFNAVLMLFHKIQHHRSLY